MASSSHSQVSDIGGKLSQHTSFFGLKLWVLIAAAAVVSVLVTALVIISLCFISRRQNNGRRRPKPFKRPNFCLPLTHVSSDRRQNPYNRCNSTSLSLESQRFSQILLSGRWLAQPPSRCSSSSTSGFANFSVFGFAEIESMTDGFADENLIGKGDSGVVYRGILMGAVAVTVAFKRMLLTTERYGTEDFIARAEMVANVRHKNIVKLLGYCVEGAERILVYEYPEKGDLHEWLHGSAGEARPLMWKKRMNIIQGVAKGLAYIHEDIEPRITHQDIKPRKILLDHQWNPKISDVGFTSPLAPDRNNFSTSATVMPVGYSPSIVNEKNDVHCFGVLIMEMVSGKVPLDQSLPQVYLVDWIKAMVASHKIMSVLDPTLPEFPSVKELKRLILIALRCVDPDVIHRPKMGEVIHMLQPRDLLLNDAVQEARKISRACDNGGSTCKAEVLSNQYQKMIPG